MLIAELDHRVKNVISCVAAIVQRTRESSGSMVEFTDALKRRIHSMANTHALLSHGRWQGASLVEPVDGELAPWRTERSLTVEGPQLFFAAEATQAMAMMLHELATNAAKYGALSIQSGHVSVRWHCGSNGRRRRRFSWSGRRGWSLGGRADDTRLWHQRDLRPDPI